MEQLEDRGGMDMIREEKGTPSEEQLPVHCGVPCIVLILVQMFHNDKLIE